ncbi:MAG: stage II sporulation protein D [Butyricicoccus sp.]|nr:stage II sporulation protein D [Butyricicoccus sp.]
MRKMLTLGSLIVLFVYFVPICSTGFAGFGTTPILQDANQNFAGNHEEIAQTTSDLTRESGEIAVSVDGEISNLPLEIYVAGVVAAEVSPDFPDAALQAQAIAARTYAVYKQRMGRPAQHTEADVCNDPAHCTAYVDLAVEAGAIWGDSAEEYENAIVQAVQETAGKIVVYEGAPIIAVFSAAAAEQTEAAVDVWGSDIPYLVSVQSGGETACPRYHDRVTVSAEEFRRSVREALPSADLSGTPDTWFQSEKRSEAGGVVSVELGGTAVRGTTVRTLAGLQSTHYTLETTDESLTFVTEGYGHGVGLSQWGARQMALDGADCETILTHYYKGTQIKDLHELAV